MIFEMTAITVNDRIKILFYAGILGWEDTQMTALVPLCITMFENGQNF